MRRPLLRLISVRSALVSLLLVPPTFSLRRTVGPPNDARFISASKACNGSDPKEFEFGVCSLLIACIYEKLDEAFKASLSSGTNIASLLPTILVLIGRLRSCSVSIESFALATCPASKVEASPHSVLQSDLSLVPRFTTPRARRARFPVTAPSSRSLLL